MRLFGKKGKKAAEKKPKGKQKPKEKAPNEQIKPVLKPMQEWVSELKTDELLSILSRTQMGLLGPSEKKLKKDILKKLKIDEKEVFSRGTLLAYSRVGDVADKLQKYREKLDEESKKSEAKKEGPILTGAQLVGKKELLKETPIPKDAAKDVILMKGGLKAPAAPGKDVSDRAQRIEKLLEEQKKLDEASKQQAQKRGTKVNVLAKPFVLIGRGIKAVINGILHGIFLIFTTLIAIPIDLIRLILRVLGGLLQGIYRRVGSASPLSWKKKINQLVIYSGINKTQEEVTGITIVNGIVFALLVAASTYFILGWEIPMVVIAAVVSFGLVWVVVYSIVNLMADKRTDEVEGALPDVLQIVSANISAGMTPYNALWVSARKEFGALAEEIKIAQKETLGGKPFTDALMDMSHRVRSNVLQRTIRLLIQGMKAGGGLPHILQGIGADIRQMRLLQKEMAANTMSYLLFILFGMMIGAPLLFSVSIQFVDVINKFQPEDVAVDVSVAGPGMGGTQGFDMLSLGGGGCPKDFDGDGIPDLWEKEHGLNGKNTSDAWSLDPETGEPYIKSYEQVAPPLPASCITPGYLTGFAMIALFGISFFGSLLLGLIKDGKQSAGVKIMPLLIPGTIGMFFLMNLGMSIFFGSMFGL